MKYSECIENFLNFLREAQREYNIAADDEKSANGATQDILHSIELGEHKYHEYARLSKALREVRQERRRAKDIEQQIQPLQEWAAENAKAIKNLEQELGAVRKAERNMQGRHHCPIAAVVHELVGGAEDETRQQTRRGEQHSSS